MRLIHLKAERFGCVETADIDFAPGLNVLFGPNDLGKSSLIEAVRAALLLPHSSTTHEQFVPWHGDATPAVELVLQTEPQRFYKITKTFGSGSRGSSVLSFSRDGESWEQEATARAVDGAVRKLLRWGVPEPGGRGGPRGLPESFLTALLLPQQSAVGAVLQRPLTDDADESGRERLTEALSAMARDPLFQQVLAKAQAQVDRAFTATGRWRTGKDSPLLEWKGRIEEKSRELTEWQDRSRQGQDVRASLGRLQEERTSQQERRDLATRTRERRERISAAQERVTKARAALAERGSATQVVLDAEKRLEELDRELVEVEERHKTSSQAAAEARERRDAAKAALAKLEEDPRADLQRQQSENRRLELERERERLTRDAALASRLRAARADEARVAEEEAAARAREQTMRAAMDACDERVRELHLAKALLDARAVQAALERVDQLTARATRIEGELRELTTARDQALADLKDAPPAEVLRDLRALEQELRVAEAAASVGLSMELVPHHPLDVEVRRDGEESETHREVGDPLTVEAEREIAVRLPNLAGLTVTAGSGDARRRLAALQRRWSDEGVPRLAAHEVGDLASLEQLVVAAAARREQAERARIEIDRKREEVRGLREQVAQAGDVSRDELAELLAAIDVAAAEAVVATLPKPAERSLSRALADAESRRKQAGDAAQKATLEVTRHAERLIAHRDAARQAEREVESAGLADRDPAEVEQRAKGRVAAMQAEVDALKELLEGLVSEAEKVRRGARAALEQAESVLSAKGAEERSAGERRDALRRARDELSGELKRRREEARDVDLTAARAELEQAEADLRALEPAEADLAADAVETALADERREQERLDEVSRQLFEVQGALKKTGAVVADERTRLLQESLRTLSERQAETELDFQAWKLLTEALKEAESAEAAHLGRALMPRVHDQFRDLTRERYGALALGPNLEARGVEAGGDTRDIDKLSVGTQEQLSTIFRLAVAEQLGSAVILDDQLTQTDQRRMRWFQQRLREAAARIQLIVVTCHPDDYLSVTELPSDEPTLDIGNVRAVDLERVVRRS